jgi:hypothetical protein
MKRRPERSADQQRKANRGNVPGVLGMEEMAVLMNNIARCSKCDGPAKGGCSRKDCPQVSKRCERCQGEGNIWGAAQCHECGGSGEQQ